MHYKKSLLGAALLCSGVFYGQEMSLNSVRNLEEVVLIDSKFSLKRENSGKVTTKITSQEIAQSPGQTIPELINRKSGIELGGSRGYEGQNLGYYIRGGNNRQVVILIDGLQVTDPSSIATDFDLRLLPLSQVESIEIIKGASSTLYGSGAATAVINIITKKPSDEKFGVHFQSSLGTNQSQFDQDYDIAEFRNAVGIHGKLKKFNYKLDFGNSYSDNLSAVQLLDGDKKMEEDPFSKINLNTRLGYRVSEQFKFHVFGNLDKFTSHYDHYDYTDGDEKLLSEQLRAGSQFEFQYEKGSLQFSNSFSRLKRKAETDFPNKFESYLTVLDVLNKYNLNRKLHAVLGVNASFSGYDSYAVPFGEDDFEQDLSSKDAHFQIIDPYANLVYISEFGFNLNTGVRLNTHSDYGEHVVFNVNPSYTFHFKESYLKALASYSTAYITPSLYQLFHAEYGNRDLKPEESETMEAGLEFNSGAFRVSAVYFRRNEQNFVDFVMVDPENFISKYKNINESFTADGFEMELAANFDKGFSFSGNYTYTQVAEKFALRIPKHKVNAELNYNLKKKTNFSLKYQFNGERSDSFYNETTMVNEIVTLDSFGLLDFFVSHQLNGQIQLFAAMTNIGNETYRELYGYSTKGRNVRLGFRISL